MRLLGGGVSCGGDPLFDDRYELLGRVTRVGRHHDFNQGVLANSDRFFLDVTFEK